MIRLPDHELWEYIRGDLPYLDLTTHLLEPAPVRGRLSIVPRHAVVAACIEEAARVGELLGCRVHASALPGERVAARETLVAFEGTGDALHRTWRLAQVLLEYACGIATVSRAMRDAAQEVNPHCEIFTTRKTFPFAKRFCVRALLDGGVLPHRIGLSETVLVFDKHRSLYRDEAAFEAAFRNLKQRCVEKKLVAESESIEEAKRLLALGADVIQMDKCTPDTLRDLVRYTREQFPHAAILAAGGINQKNAAEYAATGVNGLVTSSPYQAKTADLTAAWSRV